MAPLALGTVDDPTDAALALDDPLDALVLALMGRLLTSRAAAALADGDELRVAVVKGRLDLSVGEMIPVGTDPARAFPDAGLTLSIPLHHGGETLGVVALGPSLSGRVYTPAQVGLAQSLANATAASLAARRSATDLAHANRALAAHAQALRTLFELAQAFGKSLDRDAIVSRLGFALMGQFMVRRIAVALCDSDEGPLTTTLVRGADALDVPRALARLAAPAEVEGDLADAGWRWAVPLRAGDVTRGVAVLGARGAGTFDSEAADFAAALAALAVGALETSDRVDERLERERLREEVRLAREVQARLLPDVLPESDGLDLAARWRPSRDVSGDTFDAVDLGDGRLLVAVADVVGKGIGASLLMATLQAGFRLVQPDLAAANDLGAALVDATVRLNRLVVDSTEPHQFVTLAWAIVNRDMVHYVVAGHPPPRHLRATGEIVGLSVGGPLLGVLPEATFEAGTAALAPGDALVLYTDGATEAQDSAGEEIGVAGFDEILGQAEALTAASLAEAAERGVDAWADAGDGEDDDLTLVVVRRAGPEERS